MGLQYFEALSPGTISSIIAVLINRLAMKNDVTGYYSYPFLSSSLPSSIFTCAIVYGLYGCAVGVLYTHATKFIKGWVHDWFHVPQNENQDNAPDGGKNDHTTRITADVGSTDESAPLISKKTKRNLREKPSIWKCCKSYCCHVIPNEAKRAAVAGIIAGAAVGVIGIFVPHTMFWGEAQLQNLIDKGRTPLPIFGEGDALTAAFTAHALCMIDADDEEAVRAGFSIGCSAFIAIAKTVVIGLSLGTGIIGGHFWGPLYVGCAASHFLTDAVDLFSARFGFGHSLATYPCVVILCTMGAAHVGR
jgi:H+/Cl- antiporter ClcA